MARPRYTYSAHPLAAAAGLAMLKHLHEDGLYERARALSPVFEDALHGSFADHPSVVDVVRISMRPRPELTEIPLHIRSCRPTTQRRRRDDWGRPYPAPVLLTIEERRGRAVQRNLGLMGAVQLRTPEGCTPGELGMAVMDRAWQVPY
jgi:hypothetical protein